MNMPLDRDLFRLQFERFEERVRGASGRRFTSFKEGIAAEWEGYKENLRQKALGRLKVNSMSEAQVGDGTILERLIACIEISAAPDAEANIFYREAVRRQPQVFGTNLALSLALRADCLDGLRHPAEQLWHWPNRHLQWHADPSGRRHRPVGSVAFVLRNDRFS
jgi:hypothetical protein